MPALVKKFRSLRPSLPYAISALVHVLILVISGHAIVSSAEFGMDIGDGGMAGQPQPLEAVIELYTEPEEPIEIEPEPELEEPDLIMEAPEVQQPKQEVQPEPKKPEVPQAAPVVQQKTSVQGTGSGGAYISVNKPDYLRNPPPPYPASAKRKGQQGLVLLTVYVNDRGSVDRVKLSRSSGYSALDRVAMDCVKKWKFRAAKVGSLRVKSKVTVPVRFRLK